MKDIIFKDIKNSLVEHIIHENFKEDLACINAYGVVVRVSLPTGIETQLSQAETEIVVSTLQFYFEANLQNTLEPEPEPETELCNT
jgi:hypothetical protein